MLGRAFVASTHPFRRVSDGAEAAAADLLARSGPGEGFRLGEHGRVEWVAAGERYYRQYLPPLMAAMVMPAEHLVALMDDAGVATAVLQNDLNYGRLNREIADAVRRFPGRFIGLAQVDEGRGWQPKQLAEARRAADDGLRGLYFKLEGLASTGFREDPFGSRYEPLWATAAELGWPVYWDIAPQPSPSPSAYRDLLRRWAAWLDAHPALRCVLPNGLTAAFLQEGGRFRIPDWLAAALLQHEVLVELSLPIRWGGQYDYPFVEVRPILDEHYQRLGAARLVWGSDVPNVARFCTYRQTVTHMTRHWPGVPEPDLALVMGGNLRRLFEVG